MYGFDRVWIFFFFNDTATTEIYTYWHTLSLHDALPIWLLTLMTAPPRPPCALRPKPSAPGKASGAAVAGGVQDGRTAAKAISSRAVLMDTPTSVSSAAAVPPPPRCA